MLELTHVHPLNQGDFYVANGECITCGATQFKAPDLIEHAEDGQCYFKKQPRTEAEMDQAILAMTTSCVSSSRYGGSDEAILKRLHENGMQALCDNKPRQRYEAVVRDAVQFKFEGNLSELADYLMAQYQACQTVEDFYTDGLMAFGFSYAWNLKQTMLELDCRWVEDGRYLLTTSAATISMGYYGYAPIVLLATVHSALKGNQRIRDIRWFQKTNPNGLIYVKPF